MFRWNLRLFFCGALFFFSFACAITSIWRKAPVLYANYSAPLAQGLAEKASVAYASLKNHPLCNLALFNNKDAANRELARFGAQTVTLTTVDNKKLDAFYVPRGSDTLVITAPGWQCDKTQHANLVAIYGTRDVLGFNFRWKEPGYWKSLSHLVRPINAGVLDCIHDVRAALAFAQEKNYRMIVGNGICFSSGLFSLTHCKEQKEKKRGFDKLILDSSWPTLDSLMDATANDPGLLVYAPKKTSAVLSMATNLMYQGLMKPLINLFLPKVNVAKSLAEVHDTPILFIQSINDRLTRFSPFLKLSNSVKKTPTITLVTQHPHSRNDKFDPVWYAYICNQFIDKQPGEVARILGL